MMLQRRLFSSLSALRHENPLGLPKRGPPPTMPRKGGIVKRAVPNVTKVLLVASGKGGVGKSTVAVNLAFSLAMNKPEFMEHRPRVGILDLDIFGPSVPTLMGLQNAEEPLLTEGGGIIPVTNHGMPTMSMGYLLPRTGPDSSTADTPIVWRGLMVQKAVQQLLFDVDWSASTSSSSSARGPPLDILVIDMPPGTGDVPLTLGQLANVHGSVIVSTPQDVALNDVRKSVAMFRKINVPINGLLLNQSYFLCPSCTTPHHLFGSSDRLRAVAERIDLPVLGELPLVPGVSDGGDAGVPYTLAGQGGGKGGEEWKETINGLGKRLWGELFQ